jgi:molybdopterin/thiamine biosynthesis adenylyltransferase
MQPEYGLDMLQGAEWKGVRADSDEFYGKATARNIGLLTEDEQEVIKRSTVAIAGMGAVGSNHLLTLTRIGIGSFSIADPDYFDVENIHRQAGAFVHTLGRNKADAMADMALGINPQLNLRILDSCVDEDNVDRFLEGVDIVVDGIDFFEIDARRMVFGEARKRGLFVITSGPIAYGASLQVFDPDGMSFDEYFGIEPGMTLQDRLGAFYRGATPKPPHELGIDPSKIDFERGKGPALCSSVMLSAGVAATEVLRILLKRGEPMCVPHALYFNPYAYEYVKTHRRGGVDVPERAR